MFFKCSLLPSLLSAALILFSKDPWTEEPPRHSCFLLSSGRGSSSPLLPAEATHGAAWEQGRLAGDSLLVCTRWDQSHGCPQSRLLYLLSPKYMLTTEEGQGRENHLTCPAESLHSAQGSKDSKDQD